MKYKLFVTLVYAGYTGGSVSSQVIDFNTEEDRELAIKKFNSGYSHSDVRISLLKLN